jgi:hypothetical protein
MSIELSTTERYKKSEVYKSTSDFLMHEIEYL